MFIKPNQSSSVFLAFAFLIFVLWFRISQGHESLECYNCAFEECNLPLAEMKRETCQHPPIAYPDEDVDQEDENLEQDQEGSERESENKGKVGEQVSTCLMVIANKRTRYSNFPGQIIMRMCIDGHEIKEGSCEEQHEMPATYCFCRTNLCNGIARPPPPQPKKKSWRYQDY